MDKHPLWSERWRPKAVRDCILPKGLKGTFQKYVDDRSLPNLILAGKPGTGKTTIAKAALDEMKADYVVFNGSLNVDKDALRNEISIYASTMSMTGERKYVILDEADYLSAQHVQPALRNFMDEFSDNCGFILTANHKNRIIEPLQSRCTTVDFIIPKGEAPTLASEYHKRLQHILTMERVEFDPKAVAKIIMRYYPDFRRPLNELQRYATLGPIDAGILARAEDSLDALLVHLKDKNFTAIREWMAENPQIDAPILFDNLYERLTPLLVPNTIPSLVLVLAKYSHQHATAANSNLNTLACLVELMTECTFKT